MIQSLSVAQAATRNEQAATADAIKTDLKRVVTKVDHIEEEVVTTRILKKTNSRVEKVEEAIQEHEGNRADERTYRQNECW